MFKITANVSDGYAIELSCMERCNGTLYRPKLTNIAELKDCFVDNVEWFAAEFIDIKVMAADTHHWNIYTVDEKLCKV